MATISHYRICTPHVVHETIAGETVIVNLANGHYYSLRATGAEVWTLVAAGASTAQMAAHLQARYTAAPEAIDTALAALLAELEQAGLIMPAAAPEPAYQPAPAGAERAPFEAPVLEQFTDAEELLLLDPVHDVAEAGWPHPPAA